MAFNITSTYAGEDVGAWIMKALVGGDTLAANAVTLIPNIKYKSIVNRLIVGNLLQADSCAWNEQGTVTIDERALFPAAHKVNQSLCVTDLEQTWISANMRAGALNDDIPAPLNEFIVEMMIKRIAGDIDALIWNADSGVTDEFDGIITKLVSDGGYLAPAIPAAITSANVIAYLQEMYDLIPAEIIMDDDMCIFVSNKVAKLYKQAVATVSAEKYFVGDVELDFLGIKIIPIRGLGENQIIMTTVSNLFVGTDLESDFAEIRTIDMRETTGDDTLRFKMRFKLDAQYGYADQVVLNTI